MMNRRQILCAAAAGAAVATRIPNVQAATYDRGGPTTSTKSLPSYEEVRKSAGLWSTSRLAPASPAAS
jgi:hypothetical protein